jgi:hypothetical protein
MRIRHFRCLVVRDAMMKIPRQGPAWELPILEAIYGEGNLEDVEELETEAPEPIPPEDELARLSKAYGREKRNDGSAGESWASIAYGRGSVGVKALRGLMEDAIVSDEPKAKKGRKPKDEQPEGDDAGDPA